MLRRLVVAGLAALLVAPVFVIQPAAAAILFTCDSVSGSAVFSPGLVHDKRTQSLSSGPTAPAGPADLTVASTSDAGVKGTVLSVHPSLSADGTKVAFQSQAPNLDPGDTDTLYDIYVKNLSTGDIVLASSSDTGVKGNGQSSEPSVSADGTKVAFHSSATNLDPGDTDSSTDLYLKDLTTGDIVLASTSDTGVKGNGPSGIPALSADGTHVAFESSATNLDPGDTDTVYDVYVKNLSTGDIVLASTSDTGVKGNDQSDEASLSQDGGRVAFESRATNLDPGDIDSSVDIHMKDLTTGNITLASTSDTGVKGNNFSENASLSPDGGRVAFDSPATNLDPGDTDSYFDVHVKDLTTGDLVLASTTDTGVKGNHDSFFPALSGDGTRVLFRSRATNLDLADNQGADAFVKTLASGDITLASASDTGVSGDNLNFVDLYSSLSADGSRAAFTTNDTSLDPADTDSHYDVYVKQLPATPTSIGISDCSNGNSGTASVVDIRSYGPRPLGCPTSLEGAAGNDYADTTPILVGATLSMTIDWATGPNSYGVAAAKAGPTGTQWRFRLAITASPGHDTPATNQYLPAAGSGFIKTRLQGKLDVSALDSFDCTSGTTDPLSWLDLVNNGGFIVKNA
jgi:hypothetical protein